MRWTRACVPLPVSTAQRLPTSRQPRAGLRPPMAGSGDVMTRDGQPPMVDEQAVIAFLRQLDRGLSTALRADEQQRLRRLVLTQAVVMAVLADPRHLDQALRQATDSLTQIDP